jgi:hypothetical protein
MRRRDGGFGPVMEYLIAMSALAFKEQGYRFISLSAAPLAKAPEHLGASSDESVREKGPTQIERPPHRPVANLFTSALNSGRW